MKSIGMFLVAATLVAGTAAGQQPRTPSPVPVSPEMKGQPSTQGFSVVLVLGDLNGSSSADASVPPAARKALNDMKDFLPFKGYRLLDAEWILGSRRATTRLRGPDNQDYELQLSSTPFSGRLRVAFELREATGEPGADNLPMVSARMGARSALEQRLREQEMELVALREKGDKSADAQARLVQLSTQIQETRRRIESGDMVLAPSHRRSIIDTSFDMEIGETVVVGTSRLKDGKDGGKALIALLTAVPRNGAAK